jgi:uncharacterized damage-inducible protein DinB
MTPDTVKLLARYNSHVNSEMGKVLAGLSDAQWNQELGGYYPSIRSLCSHLFGSDLAWPKRITKLRTFRYSGHPILQRQVALGELLFPTFADYLQDRKELDAVWSQMADELSAEDLAAHLHYKNWKGVDQDKQVGGVLLHAFNHQTHHRAMISLYLDMLGKQNDFSSLIGLV